MFKRELKRIYADLYIKGFLQTSYLRSRLRSVVRTDGEAYKADTLDGFPAQEFQLRLYGVLYYHLQTRHKPAERQPVWETESPAKKNKEIKKFMRETLKLEPATDGMGLSTLDLNK